MKIKFLTIGLSIVVAMKLFAVNDISDRLTMADGRIFSNKLGGINTDTKVNQDGLGIWVINAKGFNKKMNTSIYEKTANENDLVLNLPVVEIPTPSCDDNDLITTDFYDGSGCQNIIANSTCIGGYPNGYSGNISCMGSAITSTLHLFNISGAVNGIDLRFANSLSDIDGIINITSANTIYINNSNLLDVEGLSGLNSVGTMTLNNTKITSLSGLNNLTSVSGTLSIGSNSLLVDVSALSSITSITGTIITNGNPIPTTKIATGSWLCQSAQSGKFGSGISQVNMCESIN